MNLLTSFLVKLIYLLYWLLRWPFLVSFFYNWFICPDLIGFELTFIDWLRIELMLIAVRLVFLKRQQLESLQKSLTTKPDLSLISLSLAVYLITFLIGFVAHLSLNFLNALTLLKSGY